jgi:hypothetical protein
MTQGGFNTGGWGGIEPPTQGLIGYFRTSALDKFEDVDSKLKDCAYSRTNCYRHGQVAVGRSEGCSQGGSKCY